MKISPHTYSPRIWKVEAEGSGVQGQTLFHINLRARRESSLSLRPEILKSSLRPCTLHGVKVCVVSHSPTILCRSVLGPQRLIIITGKKNKKTKPNTLYVFLELLVRWVPLYEFLKGAP